MDALLYTSTRPSSNPQTMLFSSTTMLTQFVPSSNRLKISLLCINVIIVMLWRSPCGRNTLLPALLYQFATFYILPNFLQNKPSPTPAYELCTFKAGAIKIEKDLPQNVCVHKKIDEVGNINCN